jgi:predicted nucleic acid-binding protein
MRVFLDANVIFSAAYREAGSVRVFFALAQAGACELVTSGYAADEARRNIRAKHPARLGELESLVVRIALCGEPAPETLAWSVSHRLPSKDAPILTAAVDARCHLLVTGDKMHFGALYGRKLRGKVVVMPVDAVELLVGGG